MAGRRPKPTNLRIIEGNPGKRALNKTEPKLPVAVPECPAILSERARGAWDSISPELIKMGVLTTADGMALTGLCEAYADWLDAIDAIKRDGLTYETTNQQGETLIKANPAVAMKSNAVRRIRAWLIEFGLTPAARSKLSGKGADKPEAPGDAFD